MKNSKRIGAFVIALSLLQGLSANTNYIFATENEIEIEEQTITPLEYCFENGIILGSGSGLTDEYVKSYVTNLQAVILLSRMLGIYDVAKDYTNGGNFDDVDKSSVYDEGRNIVSYFYDHKELGIIGNGNNKFNPSNNMTIKGYKKILLVTLGYVDGVDFTWDNVIQFADEIGLSTLLNKADFKFTVTELAQMTSEALQLPMKDSDLTLVDKLGLSITDNIVIPKLTEEEYINIELVKEISKFIKENSNVIDTSHFIKLEEYIYPLLEAISENDQEAINILKIEMLSEKKKILQKIDTALKAMEDGSSLLSLEDSNKSVGNVGKFLVPGMPLNEYLESIYKEWEELEPVNDYKYQDINMNSSYSYSDIENSIKNIANHELVNGYIINKSVEGRNIYALEIGTGSKTIMITSGVHGQETLNPILSLKEINELLIGSDINLLNDIKIVIMPCVNPDGFVSTYNGVNIKSNAAGTDTNRNYPSFNSSQILNGNKLNSFYSTKPSKSHYPGPYLGSEPETKAVMSFVEKYIDTALAFIDIHSQGRVIYGGKDFDKLEQTLKSKEFRDFLCKELGYNVIEEEPEMFGGEGSVTDYVTSVAAGMSFSAKYGRLTYLGNTILSIHDIDNYPDMYIPRNTDVEVITLETGVKSSLGYTSDARESQNNEYNNRLKGLFSLILNYQHNKYYEVSNVKKLIS